MESKFFKIGGVTFAILLFMYFYISFADFSPPDNKVLNKINELELKIDSINNIKDSIIKTIDSTHIKIVTNEKYYEKRVDIIITQPTDSDYEFVSKYARQHRNKRIGNHMSGT